jgi:MFS family permease
MLYAMAGSLLLGAGLAIWLYTDYDSASFWHLCIYIISAGAVMMAANFLCTFVTLPFMSYDESLLEYQLLSHITVFWIGLCYFISRESIKDHIYRKSHLTENQYDDITEGFLGHLWFQNVYNKYSLGWIYYFNVLFTLTLFALFLVTVFVLVYVKLTTVMLILSVIVTVFHIILLIFTTVTGRKEKKTYYKTGSERLLTKIPYFHEVMSTVIIVMFLTNMIKLYSAI